MVPSPDVDAVSNVELWRIDLNVFDLCGKTFFAFGNPMRTATVPSDTDTKTTDGTPAADFAILLLEQTALIRAQIVAHIDKQ